MSVLNSIYAHHSYLQAQQKRAMEQIYGSLSRDHSYSTPAFLSDLSRKAAELTRQMQRGEISRDEALRGQQRAYDIINMIQEIQGDKRRGGTDTDFYKLNQELLNTRKFLGGQNLDQYEGPTYTDEEQRQIAEWTRPYVSAKRVDTSVPGYSSPFAKWDTLTPEQKAYRSEINQARTSAQQAVMDELFASQDGKYTKQFDFGNMRLQGSQYGNRLFKNPVGPPVTTQSSSTGNVVNTGTKKAIEGIKKTEEVSKQKIEDKTEPETGSTAKPVSNLDRLKKIMAKESVTAPKKEDTYKQTTFHATKARERRRDPFTGGREAF